MKEAKNNSSLELEVTLNDTSPVLHFGDRIRVDSWHTVVTGLFLSPIIVLGIIGNIFSLLVWLKGRRRKTSTARYLSALAIADILVLSTSAVEFWIAFVMHTDVKALNTGMCKLFYYISYLFPSLSAWILTVVTVERALSVWIPHKISVSCRPITALFVLSGVVFVLILVYLPILTGVDIVTKISRGVSWEECSPLSTSMYGKSLIAWLYVDLSIFFTVPFIIIFTCNICILAKVVCLAKKRSASLHARSGQTTGRQGGKAKKMLRTVTRRIVMLSITFCVCNAPLVILHVLLFNDGFVKTVNVNHVQSLRLIFHMLMYLNNGVNFLLYCVIGSGFRRDLVGIFRSGSRTSTTR